MRWARGFATFEAAAQAGPYDERPMFPPGVDPQLCLSRNDRPQPFFLLCEQDTVLVDVAGTGRVEFPAGPVRYHTLQPGDFVYVPGGTPHRLVPETESVIFRFKAEHPGLEGVAWYCASCGTEVHRVEWDTAVELPQEGYLRACHAFNGDAALRACPGCGAAHPEVDLAGLRWGALAAEIRAVLPEEGA